MLTLRLIDSEDEVRLVLIGTLEPEDLPLLTRTFTGAIKRGRAVRLVLVKMWRADRETFRVLNHHVKQARTLGIQCSWCGPLPEAKALLKAGDTEFVESADSADMAAAAGWGSVETGRHRTRGHSLERS